MTEQLFVTKRDGSRSPLDIEKIHQVLEWAVEGLENVSISDIELNSKLQFYNDIKTTEIHQVLIKSASDLISLRYPNYQHVAARLLLFNLQKEVWNDITPPSFYSFIKGRIKKKVYDSSILEVYNRKEINQIEKFIDHNRDYNFVYAGLQQLADKYLVRDRKSGKLYETPQFAYMLIAMVMFQRYDEDRRLSFIRRFYDVISTQKLSLPTPIMAGVRTPKRQFASCTLIDVGDTVESIFHSNSAIGYYTSNRAGIGLNIGRIRAEGSMIRNGEVIHTGLTPFLKMFSATTKSTTQNGLRGGSATTFYPIWHLDIADLIVLKNNKGTEETRARQLDYCVQLSKIFYKRFLDNDYITLFSPHEVPELYEAWGSEKFDALYQAAEQNRKLTKRRIKARKLFAEISQERLETGRIYIMNMDHVNSHGSFKDPVYMSNLCMEIVLPTTPIQSLETVSGEIALCILAAVNVSKCALSDIPEVMELAVRSLDELIDFQDYPVPVARQSTLRRRSLGIGMISLAHYLAKNKARYGDDKALHLVDELMEYIQYYGLKASVEVAKEKGACKGFDRTKYADGILPIDTYSKSVDKICSRELTLDWESLRKDIKSTGLRHSAITAFMPSESSSVISNATNGVEPPRDLLSVKKSKKGTLKQIVPDFKECGMYYTLAWEMENKAYIDTIAVIQKYTDQAISANNYYNYSKFDDQKIPQSLLLNDLLYSYTMGLKTLYYCNTNDANKQLDHDEDCIGGGCKI